MTRTGQPNESDNKAKREGEINKRAGGESAGAGQEEAKQERREVESLRNITGE